MKLLVAVLALCASTFASVACPTPAGTGTAYYINSLTGDNGNNGTTTGTPWLDYTNINANTFAPDDVICFASYADTGKAYYGEMILTTAQHSGTSGHPIIFASYSSSGTCDPATDAVTPSCAIIDGGKVLVGYIRGGGSYTLNDDFASGSYSGSWTSTQGTIGTPASFGITSPPNGNVNVAQLTSAQSSNVTVSSTAVECTVDQYVLSGADTSKRTFVMGFGHGATNYLIGEFSSSADTTHNKFRAFLTQQPGGSQEFYGTKSIAASTWIKTKICMYSNATTGWVAAWVDTDGTGYGAPDLVITGVNTGAGDITRVYMGYPSTGQTAYYAGYKTGTTDPTWSTNVSFIGLAYDPTSVTPEPSRAWNGVSTVNPLQSASNEIVPNSGAGGTVTDNQWDLTQANNGNYAIFWVYPHGGGAATAVEVPNRSLYTTARLYGTSYVTFQNLIFEHANAATMAGSLSPTTHFTSQHNFFWDNSGHGQYDDKNLPLQGVDAEYFGYNDCENNHWSYHETQPLPPTYPPKGKGGHCIYGTKMTNSIIEHNYADQTQGGCLAELQDNADSNVVRYNISKNGGCLGTNTTDLATGDQNNEVYDNISINDYIAWYCAQATGLKFYNNTLYGFTKYGIQNSDTACFASGGFRNNIVWSAVSGSTSVHSTGASGNITSDYSDWGPATTCQFSNNGTCYNTLSSWPGKGANDVSVNPQVVSSSNMALLSSSPLIGAGQNVGVGYKYGLNPLPALASFPGVLDRSSYQWDIGAFVYSGSPPTTIIKATGSFTAH